MNLRAGGLVLGLLALPACVEDRVEALPPLERPSAEQRAGLPELAGRWLHAGWEVRPQDTAAVNAEVYRLVPPGEIRVQTQRLDSVAGQYGSPGEFVYPMIGEVRRDGVFTAVLLGAEAGSQFLSGRVARDTLWVELSSLAAATSWPPQTRAAFTRRPRGAPFMRLLGGLAIQTGPDSATLAAMRADSLRLDSLRRAQQQPAAVPPAAAPPAAEPPARRPAAEPPRVETPRRDTPRRPIPPPQGPARIDSIRVRPPLEPEPRDTPRPQPPPPAFPAPRETLRIPPP